MTQDRIIGSNGTLPWHLPEDLAFFKRTTTGHAIVMGRKTFDSIGRPLPNRRNIVITRDRGWNAVGVEVIHAPSDLDDFDSSEETIFIIGGAQIYEAFLPKLDELLVTHVHKAHQGDTRFPPFEDQFTRSDQLDENEAFSIYRWQREKEPVIDSLIDRDQASCR